MNTQISLSASGIPSGLYQYALRAAAAGTSERDAVAEFRAAGPMPENAQELFDATVIRVGRDRLRLVADLIAAGLTYDVPNWLSVMELDWERMSEAGVARRTMLPGAVRGEAGYPDRDRKTLPIYATISDFNFNMRLLLASQRAGTPLDTTMIEQATRRNNEAIEDAGLEGLPASVAGNAVPGVLNAPNVNTTNFTDNEAWTASGHSGQDIRDDVFAMIDKQQADRMFGPYNLYVPPAYMTELNKLYNDGTTTQSITTMDLLLKPGNNITSIKALDRLSNQSSLPGGSDRSNTVVMIQMTSDVIDVAIGQQNTPISWMDGSGLESNHMILACICPRVKDTYSSQSGICVGTPS